MPKIRPILNMVQVLGLQQRPPKAQIMLRYIMIWSMRGLIPGSSSSRPTPKSIEASIDEKNLGLFFGETLSTSSPVCFGSTTFCQSIIRSYIFWEHQSTKQKWVYCFSWSFTWATDNLISSCLRSNRLVVKAVACDLALIQTLTKYSFTFISISCWVPC